MQAPPFVIRGARASDREGALALVPRLRDFGPSSLRPVEALDAGETRALGNWFDGPPPGTALLVAEDGEGAVLGIAYAEEETDYFTRQPVGHLGILAVAAVAEGRGVGRALIAAFEDWATARGFRLVTINVFAANARATAVYERSGYEKDVVRYAKALRP